MEFIRDLTRRLPSSRDSLDKFDGLAQHTEKGSPRLAFFRRRIRLKGNSTVSLPLGLVLLFPCLVIILILVLFVRSPDSQGIMMPGGGPPPQIRKISEKYDKPFAVGCLEPNTNGPRANAAIVVLARNKELDGVIQSIKSFERHFNRWYNYPYVFLNDGDFNTTFKETVGNHTKSKVEWGKISQEHWGFPDWADPAVVKEGIAKQGDRAIMYGGMESYHHMCRFYSGQFYKHELLQKYEWYWRLEPEITYFCDITYDPFIHMIRNNKTYGFTIAVKELRETVPNIFRYASAFKRMNNITSQGMWEMFVEKPKEEPKDKLPKDDPKYKKPLPQEILNSEPGTGALPDIDPENMEGENYNMCHFWSNFEIVNLAWYRSKEYNDFFEMMDRSGGFWMERWGDAPIHSLAAGILLGPQDVHYFRDFGYRHTTIQHCPANAPARQLPRIPYFEETTLDEKARKEEDDYWAHPDPPKENGVGYLNLPKFARSSIFYIPPTSESEATPELQYPPVQADHSLTSLDFHTLMMKSTSRRLPEEPGSSLDDSTYEMLTDSLIEMSDDEAHTASIASTSGEPTPDDVSAFSDDDEDFEGHQPALSESAHSMHATHAYDDLETPMATGAEDSMLTTVPHPLEDSTKLQLDEDLTENIEGALGSMVVCAFPTEAQALPKVLEIYGRTQVRVAVKAALSSQYISAPDEYKILFIGKPEKWAQDDIVAHIHAALEASSSNTRSVMVRGQMEPLGTVIDTQSCMHVDAHDSEGAVPDITLRMENGQRLNLQGRKTPRFDLAILCHTQKRETATDHQTFDSLRTALCYHQIPLIELTDIKSYGAGAKTYDMRSLVACVEGRDDDMADFELLEVLPLDTYSFCELDPAQINRHLALISPHLTPPVEAIPKTWLSTIGDTLRGTCKQLRTGAPATTKVLLLSLAFTAMLSAFVLSPIYIPLALQKPFDTTVEPPVASVVPVSAPLVTPPVLSSSSIAAASSLTSSSGSSAYGLTVVPPIMRSKPKQDKKKVKNLSGFDIQTAGEKQFVLTPSKELRKRPQLQIEVWRNTTLVPIRPVRTITGEYFVDLEHEYPFGVFNVSIESRFSKPLLRQSFEISLGHNRTWFDQVLVTATQNVVRARSALIDISSSAATQFQGKLNNITAPKLGQWADGRQLQTAYEAAKEGFKSGAEAGADYVKHVPEAVWIGLRKATAPVRLSQTMWKARMNALRIRCNVETAGQSLFGLSDKQPSRACSELHSHAHE
ncbi:alpha-1,2-mannosyltransferase (Kre5) [Curvularia kusanoi]|uniref:Alpha-1,2-mannosyltransferase (Kre5) n=1 Tax=Curvularia kusanoi TaxID=90978 RepID=A0A9P4TNW6_CURKU|nr:alpha-1,2-mannosyltransferase (Kre5) [Curvularia kusanoi]